MHQQAAALPDYKVEACLTLKHPLLPWSIPDQITIVIFFSAIIRVYMSNDINFCAINLPKVFNSGGMGHGI